MAHRGGHWQRIVATALSFALLVNVAQVAPAAAAVPEPKPVRRELQDKRTAFSRTWDNRDGTLTYESYVEPIHFENSSTGFFEEIDSTLEETLTPDGKGFKNKRNAFTVFLPDTISDQSVSIGDELGSIRLRPMGRLGESPVHEAFEETSVPTPMTGNSRRYERAFGGADIVYDSLALGLKETIVLRSYTGKNTFSFDLDCPGYTPSLEPSGSIVFTSNNTGAVRFEMVAPFMEDSSATEDRDSAYSEAVHYVLEPRGVGWRLDVVADEAWLSDPARVYPVKIDPTTYLTYTFQNYDTYVSDAYPTTNYGLSTQARVGRYNASGTGATRTYLKPDLTGLPDDISVLYARLEAYCYDRVASSGTSRVNCAFAGGTWTEDGVTWNSQPAAYYSTYDDVAEAAWGAWNVTSVVQNYVLGLATNNGFRLYSSSESTDLTLCKFYTCESTGAGPRLTVDYTSKPTVEVLSPSVQVPVRSDATTIHARVRYEDSSGKTLCKVQAQVANSIVAPTIVRDVSVVTSAPVVEIPAPDTGWGTQTRYWVLHGCGAPATRVSRTTPPRRTGLSGNPSTARLSLLQMTARDSSRGAPRRRLGQASRSTCPTVASSAPAPTCRSPRSVAPSPTARPTARPRRRTPASARVGGWPHPRSPTLNRRLQTPALRTCRLSVLTSATRLGGSLTTQTTPPGRI